MLDQYAYWIKHISAKAWHFKHCFPSATAFTINKIGGISNIRISTHKHRTTEIAFRDSVRPRCLREFAELSAKAKKSFRQKLKEKSDKSGHCPERMKTSQSSRKTAMVWWLPTPCRCFQKNQELYHGEEILPMKERHFQIGRVKNCLNFRFSGVEFFRKNYHECHHTFTDNPSKWLSPNGRDISSGWLKATDRILQLTEKIDLPWKGNWSIFCIVFF